MNRENANEFLDYLLTYMNENGDCYDHPLEILEDSESRAHLIERLIASEIGESPDYK
jgi:hypothetical protein